MGQGQLFSSSRGGGGVDQVNYDMDRNFYIKELASEECQCGRDKNRGHTFCFVCYKKLPRDIQSLLYSKIGHGYEEARELAADFLGD